MSGHSHQPAPKVTFYSFIIAEWGTGQKEHSIIVRDKGEYYMTGNFRPQMEAKLVRYKGEVLKCEGWGKWRGKPYPHILPSEKWQYNLFEGIRDLAIQYFERNYITWHQQKHHSCHRILAM